MAKSYIVEVLVYGESKFCTNGCRFGSLHEAREYGRDLMFRWTSVKEWRTKESNEPANWQFDNENGSGPIKKEAADAAESI